MDRDSIVKALNHFKFKTRIADSSRNVTAGEVNELINEITKLINKVVDAIDDQ